MQATVTLIATVLAVAGGDAIEDDVTTLSELSLKELLSQKRSLSRMGETPTALPLTGDHPRGGINPIESMQVKGLHRVPARKTIFDYDEEDEYDWMPKKKSKSKFGKLFEVSVTTLSFLAFGSYLLCLMVSVMRQRSTDALSAMGTTVSPQIQLLQQILGSSKPFPVRVPTSFAIHPGKRRRKRGLGPYRYYEDVYGRLT